MILISKYQNARNLLKQYPEHLPLLEEIKETEEELDLAFLEERVPITFKHTLEGIKRVSTIVQAMKEFSHLKWENRPEMSEAKIARLKHKE